MKSERLTKVQREKKELVLSRLNTNPSSSERHFKSTMTVKYSYSSLRYLYPFCPPHTPSCTRTARRRPKGRYKGKAAMAAATGATLDSSLPSPLDLTMMSMLTGGLTKVGLARSARADREVFFQKSAFLHSKSIKGSFFFTSVPPVVWS